MSFLRRHRTPGGSVKTTAAPGVAIEPPPISSGSDRSSSSRVDRLLPSSLRSILGHLRGLGGTASGTNQVAAATRRPGASVADESSYARSRDTSGGRIGNSGTSRGSSSSLRSSGGGDTTPSPTRRMPSSRSIDSTGGSPGVGRSTSSGQPISSYQSSSSKGYGSPSHQPYSSQQQHFQEGNQPIRRDASNPRVISVAASNSSSSGAYNNPSYAYGQSNSSAYNMPSNTSNYSSASSRTNVSTTGPYGAATAATSSIGRYQSRVSVAPEVSRDTRQYSSSSSASVSSAPTSTTPVPVTTSTTATAATGPICDKCDGKHETDNCPYYKKPRDNHPDAQRGNKKLGGQSNLPGAHIRSARVVRQPGDGSCLFHSMSYGLKDGSSASSLRREICAFIASNPSVLIADSPLADWVKWDTGSTVAAYAKKMSSSAWGGGIEMAAVSKMKGVNVHVYEAYRDGFRRISAFDHETQPETRPVVRVLYGGGVHYDALVA